MRHRITSAFLVLGLAAGAGAAYAQSPSASNGQPDARVGLEAGLTDAGMAARGLELIAHRPSDAALVDPADPANLERGNTDLAFAGNYVFQGGYFGFQIWDVSDPGNPVSRVAYVCPGGQGDVSVYGNLLFVSVEEPRSRIDCGTQRAPGLVNPERLLGLRIFDISNVAAPRQVATVQTCRGSHTHTLVPDPRDPAAVYVYVSGTARPRPAAELAGCSSIGTDPNTSFFRIDIIHVPLASPQDARVVNSPRIFADPLTGALGGLWPGGPHGPQTQTSSQTNQCHDITAYPEYGLAAGACAGNGILLDIRNPAEPVRVEAVVDPNFAYWHSATFSNDASRVVFTDEWGGGMAPRCRATDRPEWGANAIFELRDGRLVQRSYYKLPAPQTAQENCVAHNGSLIPVPGRDIMVQGWYQGGISVFDFTDPAQPFEIAFFDRGPISAERLILGGHWSAYWYNGRIYGSEIVRGLDVLRLTPSEHLSESEIAAAELVRTDSFNPQLQRRIDWPASLTVSRAYLDQLSRNPAVAGSWTADVRRVIDRAEQLNGAAQRNALLQLATQLERDARTSADPVRVQALATSLRQIGDASRAVGE